MLTLLSILVIFAGGGVMAATKPENFRRLDGKIVGGTAVTIEEYPYQASVLVSGVHICGAAIIGKQWIITAAHCTVGFIGIFLSGVRVGSTLREKGGVVYGIKSVHPHPNFDTVDYDISLLELETELIFSQQIQPIGLPRRGEITPTGTKAAVTGWGTAAENGNPTSELQAVFVPVLSTEACVKSYPTVTDRMFCAGYEEGGRDSCQGDSGGPLVANGRLIGIVSWGEGCARPHYPGVYANVAVLRGYIEEVSGI